MKRESGKIKILFLLPTLNIVSPGRGVLNLTKSLDRSKFDPIICSMRKADSLAKEEAEREGIKVIELDMLFLFDLSVILKLSRIIKDEGIDILHNFGFRPEIYGSLAGKIAKCKGILATVLHNPTQDIPLDYGQVIGGIMNFFRWIFSFFGEDIIVAISKNAKEGLLCLSFPERKIRVIYSGINENSLKKSNLGREKLFQNLSLHSNNFIIGTLANLKPRKGLSVLIKAAKIIVQDYPEVKFLIIGKGPSKNNLENQVKFLNLQNHVIFCDYVENIADAYQVFNLIVLPSLTEGLPAVLLEAMALRIPVVATRVGGVPEIIEDSISGILVPSQNPQALAEAIIKIYKNPEITSKMTNNARSRFEKYFTINETACRYEKIYEELLEK